MERGDAAEPRDRPTLAEKCQHELQHAWQTMWGEWVDNDSSQTSLMVSHWLLSWRICISILTECRICMWSYWMDHLHTSSTQFFQNFIQHLHSNLWSKTEFLAVLSLQKPPETLIWLWNWSWWFTETICFICPVHQWALNIVQKSQPSPMRPHFLSP